MVPAASRHHGLPATRLGSGRRGAREDDAAAETRPNQSLQLKKPELSPSTSRVPQSTVAPGRVRDPWRRAASSAAAAPARLLLLAHREARSRRHTCSSGELPLRLGSESYKNTHQCGGRRCPTPVTVTLCSISLQTSVRV